MVYLTAISYDNRSRCPRMPRILANSTTNNESCVNARAEYFLTNSDVATPSHVSGLASFLLGCVQIFSLFGTVSLPGAMLTYRK